MGTRLRALLAAALITGAATDAAVASATDPVVVRVGKLELSDAEVARRLAAVPPAQLRTFGDTPAKIRERFVATVLVPELLYANEADRTALAASPSVRYRRAEGLRRTL